MSNKKIWSLPLVLVAAMLLVGLFAASVLAQARPGVPASLSALAPLGTDGTPATGTVLIYEVSGYTAPEVGATTGYGEIDAAGVVTATDSNGVAFTGFSSAFAAATAGAATPGDKNRITLTADTAGVAGMTYTVTVVHTYDTNIEVAAVDDPATTNINEAGDDPALTSDDNDGKLTTRVTVRVPKVDPVTAQFQVDDTKVVNGEIISQVGRDRTDDPLAFNVSNIGSAVFTVSQADTVTAVKYEKTGSKVIVKSNVNNLGVAAPGSATISIPRGDFDLDDDDTNNAITVTITANVTTTVETLAFAGSDGTAFTAEQLTAIGERGYHYSVTVPETTAPGSGVLPYFVANRVDADTPNNIPAEQITGVIGGQHANLYRVNNSTMAIEYSGPAGGLTAGDEHTLRLTASGDTGLANRLIVGMVKIVVADVDSPPTGVPETLATTLAENEQGAGLVKDNTEVYDFAGVGEDPEGRDLTYSTGADTGFDFDGTKLMVNLPGDTTASPVLPSGIVDITRSDNLATTDVTEDDWPSAPPAGWQFATNPPTSKYPDLTRTIDVIVSDGVASNNQTIKFTITLDMNEPPKPSADVVTATDGSMSYSGVATVGDDDRGAPILALSDIVSDADSDSLSVALSAVPLPADAPADAEPDPVPPELLVRNNEVQLIFVPSGSPTLTYNFMATISDGYNPDEDDSATDVDETIDLTMEVTIVVTVTQPPAPESDIVEIVVQENTAVCNVKMDDGSLGDCTLAGQVDGATVYTILSGVDDGDTDYDIDASTGVISVVNMPDYEEDKNPAFIVEITNNDGDRLGVIAVRVTVTDMNEAPTVAAIDGVPWVYETAQIGDPVQTKPPTEDGPSISDHKTVLMVDDPENGTIRFSIKESGQPFTISSGVVAVDHDNDPATAAVMGGLLSVSGELDTEDQDEHSFTVEVSDGTNDVDVPVTVKVVNSNETPVFTSPLGDKAVTTIPEDMSHGTAIFTFTATDEDGDDLEFNLREGQSRDLFVIEDPKSTMVAGEEVWSGELHVKSGVTLDYEDASYDPRVHVEVNDPEGLNATLLLTVNLTNVNDNAPHWDNTPATSLSVAENTARGTTLGNYSAHDDDGQAVTYSLMGADAGSFSIDGYGNLMTLESLDADRQVPCGSDGCSVTVRATDVASADVLPRGAAKYAEATVRITVTAVEDSVSTLHLSKANPVPGTEQGNKYSALANAKQGGDEYLWNLLDCQGMLDLVNSSDESVYCKMWDGLTEAAKKTVSGALSASAPAESPYDLPATEGSAPMNFVETEWANWGTVLRIEVTAESPDADCGIDDNNKGNHCVVIDVNSDSADDSLKLKAFRVNTPAGAASKENHYVAALMLVELASDATPGDDAVYKHTDGGVPALKVDEEDEVEIEFGNLRDTVDVENEAPEVSNFAPEHERAFDDADVDYTFTITDSNSGLPEPEDLPDNDGDSDYTPVVALISRLDTSTGVGQCSVIDITLNENKGKLATATHIHEDDALYCPGVAQDGEFIADDALGGSYGFAPIRDDKDFDEIDDGYDVETTIVLTENATYYVTFIVCDNAGNCAYHDPDGNDDDEELAEITVDTKKPDFVEARTGLKWDSTDNEYDDDRNYIQVIFNDLTTLNAATVEVDDFVVEGHTIVDVYVYENPDDDDKSEDDWHARYGKAGNKNLRGIDRYRDLENAVFIELADELLADETPDVTIVPNGVEDGAGNEQDDGDHEADDWISPKFTVVSITSTLSTDQDQVLAGDGDEVTLVVTSDERLDSTRPTVVVTYVNAPAGSVDTKGTDSCKIEGSDDTGTRDRGEIVNDDYCQHSHAAAGDTLNNHVEKVSNTEWIVTVTEPEDTGYYSFRIEGKDRSPQENPGSEGISADDIVTDFFDSDGDVNADDAVFWEGDINLAKPNVRVSGNMITDNEPDIEYRSPLFVEIDFTRNHMGSTDCGDDEDNDHLMANCTNENAEYAEDNFDDIVITMFVLDGVDLTDSVKTTDDQTFLVTLENIAIGDHTAEIQAMDVAGNMLEDVLEIDFEVSDRDPFERRLNPGWNLVSLPGEPADSSIGSVFGPGVEVRTVYTYDPVVPGGWMVAVRETLDSDWQGDLTEITGMRGYWVLSDAIQDWEVSVPRLAGGAAGTGTPIQPPVIPLYAGWNLIPVTDVKGNALSGGAAVDAAIYLESLNDGIEPARVLGFDTIRNEWYTVLDMDMSGPGMGVNLQIGSAYWVFVREATSLVPGVAGGGGGSD